MSKTLLAAGMAAAFALGFAVSHLAPAPAAAAGTSPATGWTVHIDAQKHFGDSHPTEVAHHWCKNVAGGMLECQIYDSDAADAHLVAVETIVQPSVYNSFSDQEKAMWHYHKTEIPKVNAVMPDMSAADAQKMIAAISDTYGKVWVLFDPLSTNGLPTGQPTVSILR